MAAIEITRAGGDTFHVVVREGGGSTEHDVAADAAALERYGGASDPEGLLRRAFEFLLEREPKEAILRRFELPLIERYFPEFAREIVKG